MYFTNSGHYGLQTLGFDGCVKYRFQEVAKTNDNSIFCNVCILWSKMLSSKFVKKELCIRNLSFFIRLPENFKKMRK